MPEARTSLKNAWTRFRKRPKGLSQTTLDAAFGSVTSEALTYVERLIDGLRMSVIRELTPEESWTLRRLEAILNDTDALVHGRSEPPQKEHDIHKVMHDYLRVCFPDFIPYPQIPGTIKHFKADCGIRSVHAAIEFKIVHNKQQVATAFSGVVEDAAGYEGSKEWTRFYAVFYQAKPFMLRSHVREDMKRIGASRWEAIIENGPIKRRASNRATAKTSGSKKRKKA